MRAICAMCAAAACLVALASTQANLLSVVLFAVLMMVLTWL